jgi:hypothetical protein
VRFDLVVHGSAKNRSSNLMAATSGNKIRNAKLVRIPILSIQLQLLIESSGVDLDR